MSNRLSYSSGNCSIARTMEIVGDRWTMHVLREAFFGVRRFEDLYQAVGCARSLLSQRLTSLVDHGLLERADYQTPGQRTRTEYRLSQKGREFLPALVAILDWGDRWTADPSGPAVDILHAGCGERVHAALTCEGGHHLLGWSEVTPVPGAGALRRPSR